MTNILEVCQLNKSYALGKNNYFQVLKNINLSIKKGEFVALMGPSGSGKSTLFYNMSSMDRASSGHVFFDNYELSSLSEKKLSDIRLKKMGFIFQKHFLLKNLCLFDNIVLSGYLAKNSSKQEINDRARMLMEQLEIAELKDRDINQVSGGQLQRASICRALINSPDIIFADEPTGALNSSSSNLVINTMAHINETGTTILLATHDIKVAAKTERIIYIFDGEIIAEKQLGKEAIDNIVALKEREKIVTDWLSSFEF